VACPHFGASSLSEIRFADYPPSATALDRILAGVPAPSSGEPKQTVIFGSRLLGWTALAKTPTAEELETAPVVEAHDLLGVYETEGGERKAWIVNCKSLLDPRGTIISFR